MITPNAQEPVRTLGRLRIVLGALFLFAGALIVRAGQVQLAQHSRWASLARRQQISETQLPAPRGPILDAAGVPLAESRHLIKLAVAPREVREPRAVARRLAAAGVTASWVTRATDSKRAWVEVPGEFLPADVASLVSTRGVHVRPVMERVYPASEALRRLVGRARPDGNPVDGIELALDTLLRGERGRSAEMRDARGRRFDSPTAAAAAPRPGNTVVLTLNQQLQDICERALADATSKLGAAGGDIVVLDPKSGAILAMASVRSDPRSTASTALTEPYEPGSTIKPFIAAALLERGRVRVTDVVDTKGGTLTLEGRTITDVHKGGVMTLRDVLQYSSNVGMALLSQRLAPREQYETLRDFGFGSPTGVPYPSEASGTLREPRAWSRQSQASLSIGYEIAVTPLQLALAYAALANGGELLEPALVREVRDADGNVLYRHEKRVVRRVVSAAVADEVRRLLVGVVNEGSATEAHLSNYDVGGKSGTARRTVGRSGYGTGQYTASFVGMFPAEEPQYVILVKLDNPSGTYYGGRTAAPVSRIVLEAAIAARDAALDRRALAVARRESVPAAPVPAVPSEPLTTSGEVPFVVELGAPVKAPDLPLAARAIPDVQGLPVRDAVRALHDAGLQVRFERGSAAGTVPVAGAMVHAGSLVRLVRPR